MIRFFLALVMVLAAVGAAVSCSGPEVRPDKSGVEQRANESEREMQWRLRHSGDEDEDDDPGCRCR